MGKELTEEQLRAFNDPWVDYFLSEQERLLSNMDFQKLMHKVESFGRPGSQTNAGQEYSKNAMDFNSLQDRMLIYLLYKQYVKWEDMDMSEYDKVPPKGKK